MEKHYSELHSRNQTKELQFTAQAERNCWYDTGYLGLCASLFKTCDHTVPSMGCVSIVHKAFTMCSLILSWIQNLCANWCQPLSHIPAVNSSSSHVRSQAFREGFSQTSVSLISPTTQPELLFTLTGIIVWSWKFMSLELMNDQAELFFLEWETLNSGWYMSCQVVMLEGACQLETLMDQKS